MSDTGRPPGPARRSSQTGIANVPRRLSYASVVTGAQSSNSLNNPTRSGILAQNTATNQTNSPHPAQYYVDTRASGKEHESSVDTQVFNHRRAMSSSSQSRFQGLNISPFWVPPYLENTRYARKLEAVYNARVRALREQDASTSAYPGSIWNRPSNARMAPSHRGMTYEIIESNPPPDEDTSPLPTRFSSTDKHQGLDLSADGLEVRYNGSSGKDLEAASIRSDYPMSPQCGIYYYEITVRQKSKDCAVAIGFSTSDFSLERLPGWEPKSWAYHGDDGKAFEGTSSGHPYKSPFSAPDVIGCGVDFNKCHAFFTKNGQDLGIAFKDINFPSTIFPCIGMKKHAGVVISVNFGKTPFAFDMINKMAQEEELIARQIARTNTSRLHKDYPSEPAFTQELIAQFLSHGGYIETARAFTEQVQKEKEALYEGEHQPYPELRNPDTFDARPRQQIRQAILLGDIDSALELTEEHFPGLLDATPQTFFQLKCRKFIELVAKAASIDKSKDSVHKEIVHSNGDSTALSAADEVFDHAMELDDEQQTSINGASQTTSKNDDATNEYDRLTAQALEYGQSLKEEFGGDSEHDKILHDIFSLMPYADPSPSPNGHLLDPSGRTKVAEDLNAAILTSLGRPPMAALETVYRQTEALLETLSVDGGPASLVNLDKETTR